MLVTFFCDAYENITYLGDVAKELLRFMQQSGTIPGAILAKDVPEALTLLQKELDKRDVSPEKPHGNGSEISMTKRAFPLVNLLKAAIKDNCDVMWKEF